MQLVLKMDVSMTIYTYIAECDSAHSRVALTTVSEDPTGVRKLCTAEK